LSKKQPKSKTRLVPTPATLRKIHVLSGNQCAKPNCPTVLVNSSGTFVASVCHIYAAEENGPRPSKDLTPEQKRQPSNLILLCKLCHEIVDSEDDEYPAEDLIKWKADREKIFSEIGNSLTKSYLEQISDEREYFSNKKLTNLTRYIQYLDDNNYMHDVGEDELKQLNSYVSYLRQLTLKDRSLLTKIIETALSMPSTHENEDGVFVHPDDLKILHVNGAPLTDSRIYKFSETLSRHKLGYIDHECGPELRINAPCIYMGWTELQNFAKENEKTLKGYICDMNFKDIEK
jgi:hypothetical protein